MSRRSLTVLLLAPCLLALGVVAACDATGSAEGGTALQQNPCTSPDGGGDWPDLYTCLFGPTGQASCSGQSTCHASCAGTGAQVSGFVCGSSSESCYEGMMRPSCCTSSDAGDDGGSPCTTFPALVPEGGSTNPASTTLWTALKGSSGVGLHNMPFNGSYTFTADDLARISSWMKEGARAN